VTREKFGWRKEIAMTEFAVTFKIKGSARINAASQEEADDWAATCLFDLTEPNLLDLEIDLVDLEVYE
jgi:hypothetical protein